MSYPQVIQNLNVNPNLPIFIVPLDFCTSLPFSEKSKKENFKEFQPIFDAKGFILQDILLKVQLFLKLGFLLEIYFKI